jgi:hypothetical protein
MTTFPKKSLKSDGGSADDRRVGNYEELSTARLTWLVLDRLVPPGEEDKARAALIARDPELQTLVERGVLSNEQAIATLRTRELRHRDPDDSVIWIRQPVAVCVALVFLLFLAVSILS